MNDANLLAEPAYEQPETKETKMEDIYSKEVNRRTIIMGELKKAHKNKYSLLANDAYKQASARQWVTAGLYSYPDSEDSMFCVILESLHRRLGGDKGYQTNPIALLVKDKCGIYFDGGIHIEHEGTHHKYARNYASLVPGHKRLNPFEDYYDEHDPQDYANYILTQLKDISYFVSRLPEILDEIQDSLNKKIASIKETNDYALGVLEALKAIN